MPRIWKALIIASPLFVITVIVTVALLSSSTSKSQDLNTTKTSTLQALDLAHFKVDPELRSNNSDAVIEDLASSTDVSDTLKLDTAYHIGKLAYANDAALDSDLTRSTAERYFNDAKNRLLTNTIRNIDKRGALVDVYRAAFMNEAANPDSDVRLFGNRYSEFAKAVYRNDNSRAEANIRQMLRKLQNIEQL